MDNWLILHLVGSTDSLLECSETDVDASSLQKVNCNLVWVGVGLFINSRHLFAGFLLGNQAFDHSVDDFVINLLV